MYQSVCDAKVWVACCTRHNDSCCKAPGIECCCSYTRKLALCHPLAQCCEWQHVSYAREATRPRAADSCLWTRRACLRQVCAGLRGPAAHRTPTHAHVPIYVMVHRSSSVRAARGAGVL